MQKLVVLVLLVGAAVQALNIPPSWARGGVFASYNNQNDLSATSVARTLTVPLDHFNSSRTDKFALRYWVDESGFRPGGPIFLEMGGEAEAGGATCSDRCRANGALMVGYEHRFYGQSVPAGDLSNANMPFLTVEQNLADAKQVVEEVKRLYASKVGDAKVVAFGGSYSGATCAWFRVAYPNTTVGCISSSGVVNAVFHFTGFDETISEATTHPDTQCHERLAAAYQAIDRAFAQGHGDDIKVMFNASNLVRTKHGDTDFFYAAADGPAMLVQYGKKELLCEVLAELPANPTDEDRISNLGDVISKGYGDDFMSTCFYDSECLRKETQPQFGVGDRQWRWQKCHQLAYFQTAQDKGVSMRSHNLTLDVLLDQCEYVFGPEITPDTAAFNAKFGGVHPKTHNIFFMDFSDDPWKRASVEKTVAPDMPFCMTSCDGCGHCGAGVPPALMKICNAEADKMIAKWLA